MSLRLEISDIQKFQQNHHDAIRFRRIASGLIILTGVVILSWALTHDTDWSGNLFEIGSALVSSLCGYPIFQIFLLRKKIHWLHIAVEHMERFESGVSNQPGEKTDEFYSDIYRLVERNS